MNIMNRIKMKCLGVPRWTLLLIQQRRLYFIFMTLLYCVLREVFLEQTYRLLHITKGIT